MAAFSQRSRRKERIDGNNFSFQDFEKCLHEISRLNAIFGGFRLTQSGLALIDRNTRIFSKCNETGRPLRILDIGFGSGESMRRIHRWLSAKDINCELTGIDIQPWCANVANSSTPEGTPLEFLIGDYRQLNSHFDIIVSTLMTHHFSDNEIVELLAWMQRHANAGWLINDLHRSLFSSWGIAVYTRASGYCELVKNDAPLSVARSFRRADWLGYLKRARIPADRSHVFWHWGFRYGVAAWPA